MTRLMFLSCFLLMSGLGSHVSAVSPTPSGQYNLNINMPDVSPRVPDEYICTAKKLSSAESYIIQYEPEADSSKAHHMLLFGCRGLQSSSHLFPGHWSCGGELCSEMTIIYGWAKNARSMKFPPNVGYLVGGNSSIQFLVLQLHYANTFPAGVTDNSGLKLHMTTERQPYVTGIYLLMAQNAYIPPQLPKVHVDVNCKFRGPATIHVFAYRVHTHRLGTVVSGYKFSVRNNSWSLLAKGNPQWPQAFYPMEQPQSISQSDILTTRCTYNSLKSNKPVYIGSTSHHEMCNLYLMYYTDYRNPYDEQMAPCTEVQFPDLINELPAGNDLPLPPNMLLESEALDHSRTHRPSLPESVPNHVSSTANKVGSNDSGQIQLEIFEKSTSALKYNPVLRWPSPELHFGQITAVTINKDGNAIIFHRGSHVWNELSFDYYNNYLLADKGPISVPTVLTIDSVSGYLLHQWGKDLFYMPHGLSLDKQEHIWLTDVALHQVFCFPKGGGKKPLLVLGERFIPGTDNKHFCKPTSTAISENGDIYIADGYCNSRVIKFSSTGQYLNQWGKEQNIFDRHPPPGAFNVPHKIILLEDRNMFCVADRENGRIQCFTREGEFQFQIQLEDFGGSLYSIAYAQSNGLLFAVCGESIDQQHLVKAFVFNITNQQLLTTFSPSKGTFRRPHDIAVHSDGDDAYVCEIGPNIVWKFEREYHKSIKKVLLHNQSPISNDAAHVTLDHENHGSKSESAETEQEDTKSFETSIVIMALLGIPILLLFLVTIIMRLRKQGKLQVFSFGHLKGWMGGYKTPHPQEKFNLGQFLNPHKGFDKVAMAESDGEDEKSDSETEEFCVSSTKNA